MSSSVVAALFVADDPARFVETISSLRRTLPDIPIVAGARDISSLRVLQDVGAEVVATTCLSALVNALYLERDCHVLCIGDGVVFPEDPLSPALASVEDDLRIATVSFLSNAAGALSFPYWQTPVLRPPEGMDEVSLTRRLRSAADPTVAPILFPGGGAALVTASGFSAVGPLADVPGSSFELTVAEFGLRARERGFQNVIDPRTYIQRPFDNAQPGTDSWLRPVDTDWLRERFPFYSALLDFDAGTAETDNSPLMVVHRLARARAIGLRVLVDGRCLGDQQMGTQVQTVSLIEALASRDDVVELGVFLHYSVPDYARSVLSLPKVRAQICPDGDTSSFGHVDVIHRPFQPDKPIDVASWHKTASRVVVTLQDLIAYENGMYHGQPGDWLAYRSALRDVVRHVDGVIVISDETRRTAEFERIPIGSDRIFVVHNGTDHLTGDEPGDTPQELLNRGFVADEFLLVLGANYAHKNRDLAILAYQQLISRGHHLALVLAGATVPHGSSRRREAQARGLNNRVFVLPDVSSTERNWLLRRASLLLYPTSAEGFGLVPYEAARFGTPCVAVDFGPLREISGALPAASRDWSPASLADAAERLLLDGQLRETHIRQTLEAGSNFTWDRTAASLLEVYLSVLGQPSR